MGQTFTVTRRSFLKAAVGGATALSTNLTESVAHGNANQARVDFQSPPIETVRIGYVGVGLQGTAHVRNLLRIPGCEIRAVCDIIDERVARAQNLVERAGFKKPDGYARGPLDFKRLCERTDLDLVYTATPWEWHAPVALASMKSGKHVAIEVPIATTIEDCWNLVETAERTRRHCVMMENCCYDRAEMMCLNMVKKALLGEILHAEAGYLHDLRDVKFDKVNEGAWRLAHSIKRNGNLYPTHGLGPVAQCMDINRGDRFEYLVSMSTPPRGLNLYAAKKFGPSDPRATQKYALGDVNVSLIHTARGKVVTLYHDTNLPRPYSRIHKVQGTNGIFEKYPNRVHIEGRSREHDWETLDKYQEYDHPIWRELEERSKGAGHGGMDFIEDYRLIEALRKGLPTDQDVYDGVAWSVVAPLSEKSVSTRSRTAEFPDFTRGAWQRERALMVMNGS